MAERTEAQPSFMRALCMGDIEESLIFPYPELPEAGKEVLRDVLGSVDALMENHAGDFRSWDAKGEFPDSFIEELRQFGMFGLVIPEEHGGLGFGSAAYSRTLQQVARYDASVAVTIGAHSSIGMRGLLLFGNPKQCHGRSATGTDRHAGIGLGIHRVERRIDRQQPASISISDQGHSTHGHFCACFDFIFLR